VSGRIRLGLVFLSLAAAALLAGQALWPEARLYWSPGVKAAVPGLATLTQLLLLAFGWVQASRCAQGLKPGNPARRAWWYFAFGLLGFFLGHLVQAGYQLILGTSPYPSVSDVPFLAGYPLLTLAAFGFVQAYRETGYPLGSTREHAAIGSGLTVACAVFGFLLLRPVLAQPGPLLERVLTAAYVTFDFVLLVPIAFLVRLTAPFHGGAVFRAWSLVLLGFVALAAGDILYAYFVIMGRDELEPLVDATYVIGYLSLVLGTYEQRVLLAA
jgi:hypothetical protein